MNKDRYLQLCREIEKYDRCYYLEHASLISDYEYDSLLKELQLCEKEHPEWVSESSPSFRIGDKVSGHFPLINHVVPMLSIANVYGYEELEDFFERSEKKKLGNIFPYTVELKIDGIAVSIFYENKRFISAVSRGNGKEGEDITTNVKTIRGLPLILSDNAPNFLEVRGEIFFLKKDFLLLNERQEAQGKPLFANPRNAAGGTLKLLDPKEVSRRRLSLSVYGIGRIESDKMENSHYQSLLLCRSWGLPIFGNPEFCTNRDKIKKYIESVASIRSELAFEIDGIVIKIDDISLRESIGYTAKHYRWAVAYKFSPEQVETVVKDIAVQVGRTGVLTPVAELEPVFISGSLISRASLYNLEDVIKKDIRPGDVVRIEKGGDVIPKIVSVNKEKRPPDLPAWQLPEICPSCAGFLEKEEGRVAVRCVNPSCKASLSERIKFFSGKDGLDIPHLGEGIIEKLIEYGLISSRADIFGLRFEDLLTLEGFREKSVNNLLSGISKSSEPTLDVFIASLGIPLVGKKSATVLGERFQDWDTFLEAVFREDLKLFEGIGEKTASSIKKYLSDPQVLVEIQKMFYLGLNITPYILTAESEEKHIFHGKAFVLTGSLKKLSRSKAEDLIKKRGGIISSSVSKRTDYLIVGESPGCKYEKARNLNIPILKEEDFIAKI